MKSTRAFSLVELSIVLVIVGLLVGGVFVGQSLIRAAGLRAISAQFGAYRTATSTFTEKYNALPGDMLNATDYWGSAGGTGADAACFSAQTSASVKTCNGDGDGYVFGNGAVNAAERFSVWKHLANAGLIEGSYTGVSATGVGTYGPISGSTNAAARISGGYFDITSTPVNALVWFPGSNLSGNSLIVWGPHQTGIMTPQEAWNLDIKFDDGNPVYGNWYNTIKTSPSGPNCTTGTSNTATYDFTVTNKNCILVARQ
jgi:prepilin-type N-terminal cleavage/methylation domain-containing protein